MSKQLNTLLDTRPKEIKRGNIYWANIPYDACNPHAQAGTRPIIVISNDMCNKHSPAIIVLPMSTQRDKYYYIHPEIKGEDGRESFALTEQPKVLEKDRLGKFIREATKDELVKLDEALLLSMGMISYLDRLRELENEVKQLRTNAASATAAVEVRVEEKIVEVPREIDEDALSIGTHVKGILDIMMKSFVPAHEGQKPATSTFVSGVTFTDSASSDECSTTSTVTEVTDTRYEVLKDMINNSELKYIPSPILDSDSDDGTTPNGHVTSPKDKTPSIIHTSGDKKKQGKSNRPASAIDRFNNRYQNYLNMQAAKTNVTAADDTNTATEQDEDKNETTPKPTIKRNRSTASKKKKKGERSWKDCEVDAAQEKPNARKWTSDKIKHFIEDCQSGNMTELEIADKYDIAEQTVRQYFSKFKNKDW